MKKFRIIRNALIIIILFISILYLCWIRENKINLSKSALLYKNMFETSYREESNITMKIKYSNDEMNMTIIQATDNPEAKEISAIIHNNFNEIKNNPNSEDIIMCTINTKDNVIGYKILPKDKKYEIVYNSDEEIDSYNNWINDKLSEISSCNYFTRGYEIINGKILYTENFKEIGLKMYFDKDKLVYMKSTKLDESFDELKNVLYTVEITYDNSYKDFTNIPEDYEKYEI